MKLETNKIWDQKITVKSILGLNETIQEQSLKLVLLASIEGIYLRIPSNGCYIPYFDQQYKYDKKETDVEGGGTYHNFGLAFDVLPLKNTYDTLDPRLGDGKRTLTSGQWERVGQIGKSLGLEWGGEWVRDKSPHPKFDSAHFQFPREFASLEYLNKLRKDQSQKDLVVLPIDIKDRFIKSFKS